MRCKRCPTTLIGKYCHNCGEHNEDFSRREPMSFVEIAEIFATYPDAAMCVKSCGSDRISAIKLYREISGLGLKDAKEAIDVEYFKVYPRAILDGRAW